jgi:cell division protein FtsQ
VRLQSLRPKVVAASVVAALALMGWVVLGSDLLAVQSVKVAGTQRLSASAVLEALGPVRGDALLTSDLGRLAQRVEQLAPVQSAQVTRDWPSGLRVTVVERTPIATVHRADGWWLVDAEGVQFAPSAVRPAQLRLMQLPLTGQVSEAARGAAQVLRALPAPLLATVTRVEASSGESVQLTLAGGARVVWGSPERSADKARILATLVHRKARVYDVSSPSVVTTR